MIFEGELGKQFRPDVHPVDQYWVSEKLDGVRAWWDPSTGMFWSRQGKSFTAPDWFIRDLLDLDGPLDGELWAGRQRFQDVLSYARKVVPVDSEWDQLTYMVFDAPKAGGNFTDRLLSLRWMFDNRGFEYARLVSHHRGTTYGELQRELDRAVADGAEGLMLHRADSFHTPGRTDNVLKVKPVHYGEATIVGYSPGRGKHEGRLGAYLMELPDGERFKLGLGFSDADREDPFPPGTRLCFRYDETTRRGVPKFARFTEVA